MMGASACSVSRGDCVTKAMMRRMTVWLGLAVVILAAGFALYWRCSGRLPFVRRGVAHQRPYKWDSYVRPDLTFTMEPMANVIAKVNGAIREASHGAVPEAIKLDTTPTRIVKVATTSALDPYMDELIASFRENEKELNRCGAEGFESFRFTGVLDGHHSLWCMLVMREVGGLNWEEKEDALHVSRKPALMECRPYYIPDKLPALMKEQRSGDSYVADAEPVVRALGIEQDIYSWSVMVPDGPGRFKSEYRFDKVFRYVPKLNVLLALGTPEEHVEAQQRLKAAGLWVEPGTREEARDKPAIGSSS